MNIIVAHMNKQLINMMQNRWFKFISKNKFLSRFKSKYVSSIDSDYK
jgi:hypothetical protein